MIQKLIPLSDKMVQFIQLPDAVKDVKIYKYSHAGIWIGDAFPIGLNAWKIPLPKADWELIGVTPLTEEQAARVMEGMLISGVMMYRDYRVTAYEAYVCASSIDSFMTMLKDYSLDLKGRYAVLIETPHPTTK